MDLTFTLADIHEKALDFWKILKAEKVIAFHGEMGTGKTTFIHALCDGRGVTSNFSSPTFSIINEYLFPAGKIFHIDLYRIKDEAEAFRAGVEDCLYSGDICLVEWPEKAPGIFPEKTLNVFMEFVDHHTRRIKVR